MRTVLTILLVFSAMASTGCSSARGPAFAPLRLNDSAQSVVYVYRPVDSGHDKFRVTVDDEPVARLLKGGYVPLTTQPGTKTISSEIVLRPNLPALMVAQLAQPPSTISLDVAPGEAYYVRLERVLGPRLVVVDETEALRQLAQCRQITDWTE